MAGKKKNKPGARKRKQQKKKNCEKEALKPTMKLAESTPVCNDAAKPSLMSQSDPSGQMENCSTASTRISTGPPSLPQSATNSEKAESQTSRFSTIESSKQPGHTPTNDNGTATEEPNCTDPAQQGKVTLDDSV